MEHNKLHLEKNFSKYLDFNWKGGVRRLGSEGVRSSHGTLSPQTDSSAVFQILIPQKVLLKLMMCSLYCVLEFAKMKDSLKLCERVDNF